MPAWPSSPSARLPAGRVRRPARGRLLQHRQPLAAHPPGARGRRARRSSAGRGRGRSRAEDWFTDVERLRELFARLVGADADGVALVPATSYGFAVAARNLELGARRPHPGARRRVPVRASTPGAARPAHRRRDRHGRARAGPGVDRGDPGRARRAGRGGERAQRPLDRRRADRPRPRSPSARHAARRAAGDRREPVGGRDAARRRARCGPTSWSPSATSGCSGPFALGYLYVAPEHRDGEPIEQNWILRAGSEDFARLVDYRDDYQPGARRFDMGQRTNFQLVPMAIAALEQLLEWGVAADRGDARRDHRRARRRRPTELGLEPLARRPSAARTCSASCLPDGRSATGRLPALARRRLLRRRCAATRCASPPTSTTRPTRSSGCIDALAAAVAG